MNKAVLAAVLVGAMVLSGCTSVINNSGSSSGASSSSTPVTEYSMEEVSSHATGEDCWMVISDSVYDVTDYVPEHNKAILKGCGQEATSMFYDVEGHVNPEVESLLKQYKIGQLQK